MKITFLAMIIIVGMSACSTHQDDGYYERANKASEKAHKEFH